MKWIYMARDTDQLRVLMYTALNLDVASILL
jgi:hypothetical protein